MLYLFSTVLVYLYFHLKILREKKIRGWLLFGYWPELCLSPGLYIVVAYTTMWCCCPLLQSRLWPVATI